MDFKHLEAFVQVVENKSFSKAAEQLYLTQPTISTHVANLEKTLHTPLIIRSTKSIQISDAGEKLYLYAKEMLTLRDEVYAQFKSKKPSPKTSLTIGVSTNPAQYILPEILASFRKINTICSFSTLVSDSKTVLNRIKNNEVDLGIVGTRTDDEDLIFKQILEEEMVLIAPNLPYYQKYFQGLEHFHSLLNEPFILREAGSGTRIETEKYLQSKGIPIEQMNIIAQMSTPESIRESVVQGLGIAIMSKKSVEDLVSLNKVLCFPLENPKFTRIIYVVYSNHNKLSVDAIRFIRLATQYRI